MSISLNQKISIELLSKFNLILFLLTQLLCNHTMINTVFMITFMILTSLLCLKKNKIYLESYFLFGIALIVQSYIFSKNGISINPTTSLKMTNTLFINLIFTFLLYQYIMINSNLEEIIYIFAKVGSIFSLIIVFLASGDILSGRLSPSINIFGQAITYNANYTALIAGFSYLIYIYKFYNTKNKCNIIPILWLLTIIILSGSRKGMSLVSIGTCMLIYFFNPKKRVRNICIGIFMSIGLYWIIMNIPILYDIAGHRVEALINSFIGKGTVDASTNTRISYIELGWEYFKEKPFTGYGLDCFRHLKGSYETYSHNNYIELLVSGGILSLVLYYSKRIIVILRLFTCSNISNLVRLMGSILFIQLITEYGIVSYYDRLYLILFIFILCEYSEHKRKKYIVKFR